MRYSILVLVFLFITPIALGISLFSLSALGKTQNIDKQLLAPQPNLFILPKSGIQVYASLPSSFPNVSVEVESADARVEIIRQYLAEFYSPLEPHANFIVETADKYSLDHRLLPAIAQKESNLCKRIPEGSYNCWGWGIHSQGTLKFDSYDEGIETVSRGLRENYIDKGYTTLEEIMSKYTPLSPGTWADGVANFMSQMQ